MSKYEVIEHQVPCCYMREYPRALANDQEDQLYLSVKQYSPLSNPKPRPGDITIIAAHANGFVKELYEPLWDDLLAALEQAGSPFRIRSIWMADVAHQGASYVMNENKLGNDPSWSDHPRDLEHFINLYRKQMPQPIVGIGHSMGGAQLTHLALSHPRLLASLVLLDPVIQTRSSEIDSDSGAPNPTVLSTFRRDTWPSREEARRAFDKSPFYQAWDARVLDRWIEFGLRAGRTLLHPDAKPSQVTLTTPPSQEVYTFLRPNYEGYGASKGKPLNRTTHADLDPTDPHTYPFYRSEPIRLYERLGEVRPSVLYISGATSTVSSPTIDQGRLDKTGIGIGGSGGFKEGRVKLVSLDGVGHLIAQEAPERTAREVVGWWTGEVDRWRRADAELERAWFSKSLRDKQAISEEWKKHTGGPPKRAKKESDSKL